MSETYAAEASPCEAFGLGDWIIRTDINAAVRGSETRRLESRTVSVLAYLHQHRDRVVSKDELLDAVWQKRAINDHSVAVAISAIRRTLGDDSRTPRYIQTVPGKGYRLIGADEAAVPGPAPAQPDRALAPATTWPPSRWLPVAGTVVMAALVVAALVVAALAVLFVTLRTPQTAQEPSPAPTLAANTPMPFTTLEGRVTFPAFSPDSRSVAFAWNQGEGFAFNLYLKHVGATDLHQLTDTPEYDSNPAFSPDGQQIAFIRRSWATPRGDCGVFVMAAGGGRERRVGTCARTSHLNVSWSADGRSLFFPTRTAPGSPRYLVRVDLDTLTETAVTSPGARYSGDDMTAVSPDGRMLAFRRSRLNMLMDLYVLPLDADGNAAGPERRLTRYGEMILDIDWSHAGDGILFTSNHAGIYALWEIAAAGGTPRPALKTSAYVHAAALSPDGRRLILDQRDEASNLVIEQTVAGAPADGTNRRPLTQSKRFKWAPEVSSDGQRLAYLTDRTGVTSLWVQDLVADSDRLVARFPGYTLEMVRWSPDSTQLAVAAAELDNLDIYLIDQDGGPLRQLTRHPAHDTNPVWSADGQTIYFTSDRTGTFQIWALDVATGVTRQITHEGGIYVAEAADPDYLYVSSPLRGEGIWRVHRDRTEPATLVVDERRIVAWLARGGMLYVLSAQDANVFTIHRHLPGTDTAPVPVLSVPELPFNSQFAVTPDGDEIIYAVVSRYDGQLFEVSLRP